MTREALGEFEHMVLLAILHLGDGVYGVPIVDEIQRRTGRTVAPAAVYITLRRLEQKGLLTSWMSDSTPERGGKSRRCVKVNHAGLEILRESRKLLDSMWKVWTPSCGAPNDAGVNAAVFGALAPGTRAAGRRT